MSVAPCATGTMMRPMPCQRQGTPAANATPCFRIRTAMPLQACFRYLPFHSVADDIAWPACGRGTVRVDGALSGWALYGAPAFASCGQSWALRPVVRALGGNNVGGGASVAIIIRAARTLHRMLLWDLGWALESDKVLWRDREHCAHPGRESASQSTRTHPHGLRGWRPCLGKAPHLPQLTSTRGGR